MADPAPSSAQTDPLDDFLAAHPTHDGSLRPKDLRLLCRALRWHEPDAPRGIVERVMVSEGGLKLIACMLVLFVQERLVHAQETILGRPAVDLLREFTVLLDAYPSIIYEDVVPVVALVDVSGIASELVRHADAAEALWETGDVGALWEAWLSAAHTAQPHGGSSAADQAPPPPPADGSSTAPRAKSSQNDASSSRTASTQHSQRWTDESAADAADAATAQNRAKRASAGTTTASDAQAWFLIPPWLRSQMQSLSPAASERGPFFESAHVPTHDVSEASPMPPIQRVVRRRLSLRYNSLRIGLVVVIAGALVSLTLLYIYDDRVYMPGHLASELTNLVLALCIFCCTITMSAAFPCEIHSEAGRHMLTPIAIVAMIFALVLGTFMMPKVGQCARTRPPTQHACTHARAPPPSCRAMFTPARVCITVACARG